MGEGNSNTILKIDVLKRCDTTGKVLTKAAALKASFHLLASFGQNRKPNFLALKQTVKHLCSFLYPKENCGTFGDLRYILYTKKSKMLSSLSPTSNMLHGHNIRLHYVVLIYSNLILTLDTNMNLVEFRSLQEMDTVTCGCKKRCIGRCQCGKFGVSCTGVC